MLLAWRSWRRERALVAALLVLPLWPAGAAERGDLTEAAALTCMYHMGEFGADSVRACVERELSAARALADYPQESQEIVARCARQWEPNGWAMVQACADRDRAAAAALAGYGAEHDELIAACRARREPQGAAAVKACVDSELGSGADRKE